MPVNLDINEFEYQLPTEKIAKYPLAERGGAPYKTIFFCSTSVA